MREKEEKNQMSHFPRNLSIMVTQPFNIRPDPEVDFGEKGRRASFLSVCMAFVALFGTKMELASRSF